MMNATTIELTGYVPGALGRITELQARYYAEHWDLGLYFEAKAATETSPDNVRFGNPPAVTLGVSNQRPTMANLFDLDLISGLHGQFPGRIISQHDRQRSLS